MFTIEKPTVENVLKSTMTSGLGLDISKNSTGISIYEDGKVETYQSVIEFNRDSELHFHYMVKALEDDLLELVEGKHFDVIGIEDVIESINFETLRALILLNSVIDKLIAEGKVTCNYFRRVNNSVWKKWLRTLRPVKKYENDKVEVEHTLKTLDFHLVNEYEHLSNAKKEDMGYQDQLDAVGVLVGVGLERLNSKVTPSKSKQRYKLHVELYSSVEDVLKTYKAEDLNQISLSGNLLASTKKFFKELGTKDALRKFYMEVDTLGTLGVNYGIQDLHGTNYVVLYQTKK